jgi:hypothetical protein
MCLEILKPQADQFGNPKSTGKADVEHRAIASSRPGGRIGSIQHSLQLFVCEIIHKGLVGFFEGNRHEASNLLKGRGDPVLKEMSERFDRRQASIPRFCGIAPVRFQVFQKRQNQSRIQLLQDEGRRRRPVMIGGETDHQLERIGVGITGMGAQGAVSGQIFPEKRG